MESGSVMRILHVALCNCQNLTLTLTIWRRVIVAKLGLGYFRFSGKKLKNYLGSNLFRHGYLLDGSKKLDSDDTFSHLAVGDEYKFYLTAIYLDI